jgi:hypothetical protein
VALQCAGMLTVCVALRSTLEGKQNSYVRTEIQARELRQAACRIFSTYIVFSLTSVAGGPCSVFSIATVYGLHGPKIESRWGRDFLHLSRPALRPTQPPVKWVPGLSRG